MGIMIALVLVPIIFYRFILGRLEARVLEVAESDAEVSPAFYSDAEVSPAF